MRKKLALVCFVVISLMTCSIFAQNKSQSQGQKLQQCFEKQGIWKEVGLSDLDQRTAKISVKRVLKVSDFPLGKFCGESLPEDKLQAVTFWANDFTANLNECLEKMDEPESVKFTFTSDGGGFSDAIDFFTKLLLGDCKPVKLEHLDFLVKVLDDHVKLGLLRTFTTYVLAKGNLMSMISGKYLILENIVWQDLVYHGHRQDKLHTGGDYRYAEIIFGLEIIVVEKEKEVEPIVELPKIELPKVEPIVEQVLDKKVEEKVCEFGLHFVPGIGAMLPLIGDARNIFGVSALAGADILLNNSCWGNWEFGPSLVMVLGVNRVPYDGDRWQTLHGYGVGFKARRKVVISGRQGYMGGEARWLYLVRSLDNSVDQEGNNIFVGPLFGLYDFELRLGYLGMEINKTYSPNLYSELVYTF